MFVENTLVNINLPSGGKKSLGFHFTADRHWEGDEEGEVWRLTLWDI